MQMSWIVSSEQVNHLKSCYILFFKSITRAIIAFTISDCILFYIHEVGFAENNNRSGDKKLSFIFK
jgi:hypothetical protein